jgi:peroxiredoxin Q/BCP
MKQVGDTVADFSLQDANGKTVKLSDFAGKKKVIYFYPKDDTPGCTKEACGFRDVYSRIAGKGAVVIGISADPVENMQSSGTSTSCPSFSYRIRRCR